jgi:hypothetical protein
MVWTILHQVAESGDGVTLQRLLRDGHYDVNEGDDRIKYLGVYVGRICCVLSDFGPFRHYSDAVGSRSW